MKKPINIFTIIILYHLLAACQSKPEVVYVKPIGEVESSSEFNNSADLPVTNEGSSKEHRVKVEEVLNTDKYTYLNVTEEGDKFWIAIPRKEVEIGGTYYYKGGLLKRNFESKEYNRVFETIYLVSDITSHPINSSISMRGNEMKETNKGGSINVTPAAGSIRLTELFSNPGKYQGKRIQVTGKCVKVNPMIMDRNWIHIQDGSGDGLDLTVTTTENISINAIVSLEGTIALDKDFGAGYKYDIIMEKAVLK